MTLKQYLTLMSIGTGLCWLSWVFVLFSIDPTTSGVIGFLFFYLSLFLAVTGTFSVIGFMIRRMLVPSEEIVFRHVKKTFRQSLMLGILVVVILFLVSHRMLTWWNFLLLLIAVVLAESFVFTNRKHGNIDYVR